jgi:hypothetical protein
MIDTPRPRGRPRKHPEAPAASGVSREAIKVLGKRLFGRKDLMPGAIVRLGGEITQERAEWAIGMGLAVWVGDAKAELEAGDRRRLAANKAAAESTMRRFDMMSPAERAEARDEPEEGQDV